MVSSAEQNYVKAITLYSNAIEFNPNSAVLYANRSFAYLRTECFGYALEDASKAINLDKTYVKGYYRRGDNTQTLELSFSLFICIIYSCLIHGFRQD